MPYLPQDRREEIDVELRREGLRFTPVDAGDLNYVLTRFIDGYIRAKGGIRYAHLNDAVAALEIAKAGPGVDPLLALPGRRDDQSLKDLADEASAEILDAGIDWQPQTAAALFIAMLWLGNRLPRFVATGALECCKLELYRLIGGPYEDVKMSENGAAYTIDPRGGRDY